MREHWPEERKLLNRWAIWCLRGNERMLMRLCGLSWAGSPPAIMARLWERGAESEDDVTGYAPEPRAAPDYQSAEVDRFMGILQRSSPAVAAALIARHRRMVHGELILLRPEWWLACSLYGRRRSRSHQMLADACERGYAVLRQWLADSSDLLQKSDELL